MKSPFNFIVRPCNGRRYDNLKEVGGIELITSVSQEDHTASNRYAEVIQTPVRYSGPVEIGDTLLVHHNVFKYYYDMKGRQKSGRSHLMDDLFLIEPDQYYMYKKEGLWHTHDKYCFVKPAERVEHYLQAQGREQPLVGYIRYINEQLKGFGLSEGDKVSYLPDSEYEFDVEGEKLYRMFTSQIALKL